MKRPITLFVAVVFGILGSSAWAGKKVQPVQRMARSQVIDRATEVQKPNFGKTVSKEAKLFHKEPLAGYRNFGQWVSCQRSHSKKNCPKGTPTGGTPNNVTPNDTTPNDVTPVAPTVGLTEGSNGT